MLQPQPPRLDDLCLRAFRTYGVCLQVCGSAPRWVSFLFPSNQPEKGAAPHKHTRTRTHAHTRTHTHTHTSSSGSHDALGCLLRTLYSMPTRNLPHCQRHASLPSCFLGRISSRLGGLRPVFEAPRLHRTSNQDERLWLHMLTATKCHSPANRLTVRRVSLKMSCQPLKYAVSLLLPFDTTRKRVPYKRIK